MKWHNKPHFPHDEESEPFQTVINSSTKYKTSRNFVYTTQIHFNNNNNNNAVNLSFITEDIYVPFDKQCFNAISESQEWTIINWPISAI